LRAPAFAIAPNLYYVGNKQFSSHLLVGTKEIVLLTTGSFVLVYVLGCASAVKLLPRRSWSRRIAVFALVSVLGLLVMAGAYLLWPLLLAAGALAYHRWRERRPEPGATRPTEGEVAGEGELVGAGQPPAGPGSAA
jgi:amino acid efflux transporter